jgi:hypothetical protein
VVRGDIMLGSYSYVERLHFGPLSYAVMEDSGWYQPNWETVVSAPPAPMHHPSIAVSLMK